MPNRVIRTDESGIPIKERQSDLSRRVKVEAFLENNWRTIMTAIWVSIAWYAANVYGPIKEIPSIAARDSVVAKEHKELRVEMSGMEKAILTLSRISCFNLDAADRIKYDINCGNIPLPDTRRK